LYQHSQLLITDHLLEYQNPTVEDSFLMLFLSLFLISSPVLPVWIQGNVEGVDFGAKNTVKLTPIDGKEVTLHIHDDEDYTKAKIAINQFMSQKSLDELRMSEHVHDAKIANPLYLSLIVGNFSSPAPHALQNARPGERVLVVGKEGDWYWVRRICKSSSMLSNHYDLMFLFLRKKMVQVKGGFQCLWLRLDPRLRPLLREAQVFCQICWKGQKSASCSPIKCC
jgi:hypothetical protein